MSNLLRQGLVWLEGVRKSSLSDRAVYSRGEASVEIDATFTAVQHTLAEEYGSEITGRMVDVLVDAAQLALVPAVGDAITCGGRAYQVAALAGEAWRWNDFSRTTMRIHANGVDGVPA